MRCQADFTRVSGGETCNNGLLACQVLWSDLKVPQTGMSLVDIAQNRPREFVWRLPQP